MHLKNRYNPSIFTTTAKVDPWMLSKRPMIHSLLPHLQEVVSRQTDGRSTLRQVENDQFPATMWICMDLAGQGCPLMQKSPVGCVSAYSASISVTINCAARQ